MSNAELFAVTLSLGTLIFTAVAVVVAYQSSESAKKSVIEAKLQNEITQLDRRISIQHALSKYISVLIGDSEHFDEQVYWTFAREIGTSEYLFNQEINRSLSEIHSNTLHFFSNRDNYNLLDEGPEKASKGKELVYLKRELRQETIAAMSKIRSFIKDGMRLDSEMS